MELPFHRAHIQNITPHQLSSRQEHKYNNTNTNKDPVQPYFPSPFFVLFYFFIWRDLDQDKHPAWER